MTELERGRPDDHDEIEAPTGRLARTYGWLVVWLSPLVVAAVVAGAVAAALLLPSIATAPAASLSGLLPSHPKAVEVQKRSLQTFGVPLLTPYIAVQRNPNGLSRAAIRDTYRRAYALLKQRGPADLRRVAPAPVVNVSPRLGAAHGERNTTIVTYLFMRGNVDAAYGYQLAKRYVSRLPKSDDPVGVTGSLPARIEQYREIQGHLHLVEIVTVSLIVLIVGIAFRALLAPLLTIVTAGIAFVISQHALGWTARRFGLSMPSELTPISVALMLGIVTDYSVFFLNGTRRRLRAGAGRAEAVRETAAGYAPIVLAAGLLVTVGLLSLLLGTLGFFHAFGPGMAITVLCGLVVSLTFVPAMLALLGRAVFWPGLHSGSAGIRRWRERISHFATGRVVAFVIVVAAIVVLVFAALGLRSFGLGLALERALPSGNPVARAAAAVRRGFAPGMLAPTELDVYAPNLSSRPAALAKLQDGLLRERGVATVLGPADRPPQVADRAGLALAPKGNAARYLLVFAHEPTEAAGLDALRRVSRDLPTLLRGAGLAGATTGFAGESALGVETVDAVDRSLWRIALGAALVNLVFLAVFLRALVAPFYLLAASALGLAATFGLTTTVFHALGYGGLPYYLPVAVGVLLVSLGSDYNLFVVGRIWQEAERRPLREAIAYAAPRASRAITVAGVALALSFVLLALVPIEPFAVLAFSMAVGILIDAFVVRTLLVPALIALFGHTGWWPRRLDSAGWTDGTSSSPEAGAESARP
ncbi:MAG TPA: MMPL family transporter [Gaiellaceae bacterium]|nr:MMPL family transporter [Gaiellaceae bacterium]